MNKAGDIAEMAMMFGATKAGFMVFTPHGHNTSIDMILVRNNGKPITVQVKKGVKQPKQKEHHVDSWKMLIGSCRSSQSNVPGPRLKRYTNEFDIMALYIQELNTLAFYELKHIKDKSSKRWNERDGIRENWSIFNKWDSR